MAFGSNTTWRTIGRLVLSLGVVTMLTWPLGAGAVPVMSRDISTSVLFAYEELSFKGPNATTTNCTFGASGGGCILGGNVGVNRIDPNPPPPGGREDMQMGAVDSNGSARHSVTMSAGAQTVADTMDIAGPAGFSFYGDVFANTYTTATGNAGKSSGPTRRPPAGRRSAGTQKVH